ncbi:hypothetical protein [Ruania halotolerans]|uniref:hypothetical protein n=1 Tax=Ruania halotolerans TaxID=2897773 RepID=UPI001E410DF4|nr:hypothetical protein [Ruania halotolerans]UFU05845.1 hypothetical protein LQF10_15630 [Ruania halotolerans]
MAAVPTTPPDVVIARALRAHTRTLLAMCTMAVVLALIGAGALQMAGPNWDDLRILAGLTMLGSGQLLAIVAAIVSAVGWIGLVRAVGAPGTAESTRAVTEGLPRRQVETTARRLALLIRVTLAVAAVGITVWVLAAPGGVIGAAVGAVLVLQVAVVIAIVRVSVLVRPRRP